MSKIARHRTTYNIYYGLVLLSFRTLFASVIT